MSKRSKYNKEEKYEILKEVDLGRLSTEDICLKYEINYGTYKKWEFLYQEYGLEALAESKTWKRYSKELKENAVLEYLNGEDSFRGICRKYEISAVSVLERWIKRYNSHNKLNTTKGGNNTVMTKSRNVDLKEKIEIVKYCIEQNKDYHKACEIYKVSYHQVYQWVKKYEELGENGLVDRRGKAKIDFTEEDKDKIEMRKLKKDNQNLKMENDFLKKLQELERRGY
ncbi:MAG: helix-turn-helix domain-containing protein [Gudongella sp.]|nr:helix-turn-helix domain-containing protein [Gudongella sp.]